MGRIKVKNLDKMPSLKALAVLALYLLKLDPIPEIQVQELVCEFMAKSNDLVLRKESEQNL